MSSSPGQAHVRALLAVAGLLLLSAAAGFLAHRLFSRGAAPGGPSIAPPVAFTPAPTNAPEDAPPPPPKVPERIPDITLPGIDGKPHRLTDWKGRPLIVNFWATWCEPCRREIPLLKSIRAKNASNGLEVVGIAIDYADLVRQYASERRMDYPLLVGEREGLNAARAFGMETVLPFSVFADRQGRVVTVKVGELHADEAELILGRVRQVDRGALPLEAAQAQISQGIRALRQARATQD